MTSLQPTAANSMRRVLVIGLGASGVSVLRYLTGKNAEIVATDSRQSPAGMDALRAEYPQVEFRLGGFSAPRPWTQFDLAVLSPGIGPDQPFVRDVAAAGVPVVGDIELFAREVGAETPVVAITGSNGKSTVTTLVGEMARRAGIAVKVGGNLGPPALDLIDDGAELYVLEISSFQLETTFSLSPRVAAWLNLSPDHLDRHHTLEGYAAAKARVFDGAAVAVVNRDDDAVMAHAPRTAIGFSLGMPSAGDYGLLTVNDKLFLARDDQAYLPVSALRIQGLHNAANALAALAIAEQLGVARDVALEVLRDFRGLPHRCEWVAEIDGVTWIDDSKGTNVGATLAAIQGLPGPIIWLGGGQGKGQDFSPLRQALADKGRAALVFGQDAGQLAAVLDGALPVHRSDDLLAAVGIAHKQAHAGDRVLLSPACASQDQFRDYRHRGQVFQDQVRAFGESRQNSAGAP